MDLTSLMKNFQWHDSIMVVVDKLSKDAHFIHVKSTHKAFSIADSFMKETFRLHGVLKVMVSDRDTKFTGNYGKPCLKVWAQS